MAEPMRKSWQNTPCPFCSQNLGYNGKLVEKTRGCRALALHRTCADTIRHLREKEGYHIQTLYKHKYWWSVYRFHVPDCKELLEILT